MTSAMKKQTFESLRTDPDWNLWVLLDQPFRDLPRPGTRVGQEQTDNYPGFGTIYHPI